VPASISTLASREPIDFGRHYEAHMGSSPKATSIALVPMVTTPRGAEGLRDRALADGFVYVPQALPDHRLAPLRAVVDAALTTRGWVVDGRSDPALRLGRWDDSRWIAFLGEVLGSEAYRELAAAPELLEILRTILGTEPRLHVGDVCRLVSPGAHDLTTPPHQDAAYLADARDVWTAWFPLAACPLALGPLALLPGSHHGGLREHAPVVPGSDRVVGTKVAENAPWCSHDLAAGDVILFSSLTVHRALPNITSDQLRISVDFRYRPETPSAAS
jgi:Phytanoyl-CoA dioxygenase (PhyH)